MKTRLFLLFATLLLASKLCAQQNPAPRFHEFGISFATLNDFGLRYKYGGEKTMLRISMMALDLGSTKSTTEISSTIETTDKTYGGGFNIGFDHRIPLYANFNLLLGAEIGLAYTYDHSVRKQNDLELVEKKNTYTGGLSMIFGVDYTLLDHLVLGAEINPTIAYQYSILKASESEFQQKSQGWEFRLVTNGAGLYVAYRFGK